MRRAHVNQAPGSFVDPATLTAPTWKLKGVQTISIDHGYHQVAILRDCFERYNQMPHAALLARGI